MTTCNSAIISNIQRFSLDDGPGIRTTVFLKGCNLSCKWCHNPECISFDREIQFLSNKCVACGRCSQACAYEAKINGTGEPNREKCVACGKCVDWCYNNAITATGEEMSVEALIKIIKKDIPYYTESGGGVTISGGEPMLRPNFVANLLKCCKDEGIHTAVDTAGCVSFDNFKIVNKWVDLFLYDVKMYDAKTHLGYTGVDNKVILENLRRLEELSACVRIRMPIIKGINDNIDELKKTAGLLSDMKHIKGVDLLPYHNFGAGKYISLGKIYEIGEDAAPDSVFMEKAKALFTLT